MDVMNENNGIGKMYEKAVRALHIISYHIISDLRLGWKKFKDDTKRLCFVSCWV